MKHLKVGFVGAGNMASSIVGGLLDQGLPPQNIAVSDPSTEALQRLLQLGEIGTSTDNQSVLAESDVVVLAVKPQHMRDVALPLREPVAASGALVISIAAGITLGHLAAWLGADTPVVRCMPNTPALLRCGASALYPAASVSDAQRELASAVLGAVGSVVWVDDEAQMDAVTALSGSGPAYLFLFMEAMAEAGEALGLPADTSRALAVQTALGAARMAAQDDLDLAELRRRVTSPGGTTERALQHFEQAGLRNIVNDAMDAAAQRSRELASETG
ncbi:MAG: pyrroline-5-carboxylate reductase [Halieaceae bacterium]|nr:pyrroline-5-carboxylate reductase [Halieaceae bacterium]